MTRWPICAQVGALHGILVGFGFGLIHICCQSMTAKELVGLWLIFAGLAVLVSLFVLLVLRKYAFGSVLWAVILNALLVALVVILVMNAIGPSAWSPLLGILLGFLLGLLVGAVLCRLCGDRLVPGFKGRD
jgi:hypothetical protein